MATLWRRRRTKLAALVLKESSGDVHAAVTAPISGLSGAHLGDRTGLFARLYREDPARMKQLSWLLFNLDEFIYVR